MRFFENVFSRFSYNNADISICPILIPCDLWSFYIYDRYNFLSVALASFHIHSHNYTLYTAYDADNGLIKVVAMQFELKGPGQLMASTP